MRSGLALVIDGLVISKRTLSSPLDVVNLTLRWAGYASARFPGTPLLVRIGTGSKLFSALYLREVSGRGPYIVQLVDEHHTSIASGAESDRSSAVLIAKRAGRCALEQDYNMPFREGHIRTLKRLYLRLTGGRMHLSSEDARDIIEGRQTLRSLLNEQD
jgi:hypothetical protein